MVRRTKQAPKEPAVLFTKARILRWMRWYNGKNDLHPELTRYERQRKAERAWKRSKARKLAQWFSWRKSQQQSY